MQQWIARTKKMFKINKTNINNSNRKITDYYVNKERIIGKTLTDQMQKKSKTIQFRNNIYELPNNNIRNNNEGNSPRTKIPNPTSPIQNLTNNNNKNNNMRISYH